jgi:hypothetical protein
MLSCNVDIAWYCVQSGVRPDVESNVYTYLFVYLCSVQTGQVVGRVNNVSGHVKTQLIAHDKEVYDIAFSRAGGGRDMFASVG